MSVGIWAVEGAAIGFLCSVAIISIRQWIWGAAFGYLSPTEIDSISISHGALLGAIYIPIARLILLDGQNEWKAITAACITAIALGVVGFRFGGGPYLPTVSASIGFWMACGLIYEQRRRERYAAGFNSYFK